MCNNSSVWVCLFSLSFHFSRLANWRRLIREWPVRSALTFQLATVGSPSVVRQGWSTGTGLWDAELRVFAVCSPPIFFPLKFLRTYVATAITETNSRPQTTTGGRGNWDRTGDEECKRREAWEESRKKNKGEKKKKRVDNVDSWYAIYDLLFGFEAVPIMLMEPLILSYLWIFIVIVINTSRQKWFCAEPHTTERFSSFLKQFNEVDEPTWSR